MQDDATGFDIIESKISTIKSIYIKSGSIGIIYLSMLSLCPLRSLRFNHLTMQPETILALFNKIGSYTKNQL